MDQAAITRFVTTTFAGVDTVVGSEETGAPEIAWGDTFFIYDPDRKPLLREAYDRAVERYARAGRAV